MVRKKKTQNGEQPTHSESDLQAQLTKNRRMVDFDTFDIQVQQLLTNLEDGQIWIAPAYQRQFRWDNVRCSQLVESLLLGVPVPSLFMATNEDSTWEVVDGVQRLSALSKFGGSELLRSNVNVGDSLRLTGLQKLTHLNGYEFTDLPRSLQTHLKTRPLKVVTLTDKSDNIVRYDLFERLNTGGIDLSNQEIRDCVFQGEFADFIGGLAKSDEFTTVLKLTSRQKSDGTDTECVLRFFAYLDRYKKFDHLVKGFLNEYMEDATKKFDYKAKEALFHETFIKLSEVFPDGIRRPNSKRTTPLNLYEGVAVGAAIAIRQGGEISDDGIDSWMASDELLSFTTGSTNDRTAVKGRIEFCRDRFLGVPYVPNS